jgi:hypothetical protein
MPAPNSAMKAGHSAKSQKPADMLRNHLPACSGIGCRHAPDFPIIRRLWKDLTKTTPSHLSIIGPRYAGKTVLMNGLAERMRLGDSPYIAAIVWDVGHQTPDSNEAFLNALCRKLGEGLKAIDNVYGDQLLALNEDRYSGLREVLDALHDDGFKVLMLWDGFDKPLSTGKITRNLWDQLRELASNPSLRLVTATRRPLHELIRSEESVTSDFWNVFDMNPIKVGVFDEDDRDAIMATITRFSLKSGAKSELENWTAGYPPLYLSLINHLIEIGVAGEIDNIDVNKAAEASIDGVGSILQYLWSDCPETAKDLYRHLVEYGETATSDIGKSERVHLGEKGFVKLSGSKVTYGCRLLEQYVKVNRADSGSIKRLFGNWEAYSRNIRSLLEHRLGQLTSLDATLCRFIQRSIEDIPDQPEVCLSNMRGIVDKALDLIWDVEFGPGRAIPLAWFTEWQHSGEKGSESYWDNKFPIRRGHQIRLLQLMTGTQNSAPKAKRVSKNTCVLASAAHGFGDFGQHIDGTEVTVGVAVSAVNICIELAACLEKDIGK